MWPWVLPFTGVIRSRQAERVKTPGLDIRPGAGDTGDMRFSLPYARAGQTVGLLGGSFDPPHAGHVHITREALKRFGLDQVWWLVSPGNPLKDKGPASMERRLAAAATIMQHPRVKVTDIEDPLGTRYTAATLERLLQL